MTPAQRSSYFLAWADVCAAQGWSAKDAAKRKEITARCMAAIGGPATSSTTDLGEDEVTALFCYLQHLADPASLDKSARWDTCQTDYKTFARAKQADWHESQLYGTGKNKLDRDRFKGEASASRGPLEDLDPEEVRRRHLTFASRHQAKQRATKRHAKASAAVGARTAPEVQPTPPPAPRSAAPAMPAVVTQEGLDGWDGEI